MRRTQHRSQRPPVPDRAAEVPDLQSQLEGLLHQVWSCEAEWQLDDRILLASRQSRQPQAPGPRRA
jgi:hypothetical protein